MTTTSEEHDRPLGLRDLLTDMRERSVRMERDVRESRQHAEQIAGQFAELRSQIAELREHGNLHARDTDKHIADLSRIVLGNGDPALGLVHRVQTLTDAQKKRAADNAAWRRLVGDKRFWIAVGLALTIIAGLLGINLPDWSDVLGANAGAGVDSAPAASPAG